MIGEVKCSPMQAKLDILCRVWAGEKIAEVARGCGISRQVIYVWKRKAESALYRSLKGKKRGPKVCDAPGVYQVQEIGKRTEALSRVFEKAHPKKRVPQTHFSVFRPVNNHQRNTQEKRPQRCSVCGCEKIYKNGTYARKNQSNGLKKRQVVQRYICIWCKSSICL